MTSAWVLTLMSILASAGAAPPRAAIVYLTHLHRAEELVTSLDSLYVHFLSLHGAEYPVVVFYEPEQAKLLTPELKRRYRRAVRHLRLSNTSSLSTSKKQRSVLFFVKAEGFYDLPTEAPEDLPVYGGKGLGYRLMCRFWAYGFFKQPLAADLDYFWRLDTDTNLLRDIREDPFTMMRSERIAYLHARITTEELVTTDGLWDAVLNHLSETIVHPKHLGWLSNDIDWDGLQPLSDLDGMTRWKATQHLRESGYNMLIFYNNFEVSRMDIWRSSAYEDLFRALEAGVFKVRWGDAPIRTMAVSALKDVFARRFNCSTVQQWKGLHYHHKIEFRT